MKSVQIKFLYFIIFFFCFGFCLAGPPAGGPPPPPLGPPPPPGGPIDAHIVVLLGVALCYGLFVVKKNVLIKKGV